MRDAPADPTSLIELIALAQLERDPARAAFGLEELREIPRSIGATLDLDAAATLAELGWAIDRKARAATLPPDSRLHHLARDRAARLDAAHALIARRWPDHAAQSVARTLGVARTYRLITLAPDQLAPCLADRTWGGQDFLALRGWRGGDVLMFHVKQRGQLCAIATTLGEPYDATARSWQDTSHKRFPRRIAFRVAAQLDGGIDTRAALAPLRAGEPARWFKGFVGTNHVIKPDDADALLAAFEAALAASP